MLHRKGERRIRKNREQEFKALLRRNQTTAKGDWTSIYEWVKYLILSAVENGQNLKTAQSNPLKRDLEPSDRSS